METRWNIQTAAPNGIKAMLGLEKYLSACSIDKKLLHMIKLRASQLNGCAYCIDMHWKDARAGGETEQRLYGLDAWREAPYYTQRERAAFEWTEALTQITQGHVPDSVYESVRTQLSETELSDLTLAVVTINAWNRIAISARSPAGAYQPVGTHA
jgi:AhpD family alkylhydroperoxidase